ncbi:MAG: nuclear transport factor 2 family protein [Thermomicrobiales bacterium]
MGELQERNKAVVRRFYEEVMNQGKVDVLDEVMDAEFDDHGEALFGSPHGRAVIRGGIEAVHSILKDLNVRLEDMVASGDMVGVRGTMTCKLVGPFLGVDASGNELKWGGIAMFEVKDGKITRRWFNSDSLNIMTQLGLYPPAPKPDAPAPKAPREIINQYYDSVNAGDWDTWLTLFAYDMEMDEQLMGHVDGIDPLRDVVGGLRKFKKFQMHPQHTVVEGDEAMVAWNFEAIDPNGKEINVKGANFFRFKNGKIVYMANFHDTKPFS